MTRHHAYTRVQRRPKRGWLPTRDEAQAIALAHLGQHREVAG